MELNINYGFTNYTVQSGRPVPANNKATTERFSISTQSLDYVIGTFRLPGYDTRGQPLNTIMSTQDSLEEGLTRATAEEQVNAGLRRVYNQSRYFAHNGDSIVTTKWAPVVARFPVRRHGGHHECGSGPCTRAPSHMDSPLTDTPSPRVAHALPSAFPSQGLACSARLGSVL